MFPILHQTIANEVLEDIGPVRFHDNDSNAGSDKQWSTHVMGRFGCPNGLCGSGGWGSKKVAIRIRGYGGDEYNAVVFNQRCRACHSLGKLTLDEDSYVERVAYWLRKWAGMVLEKPPHSGKKGPPHRSELCEGCKQGCCQDGTD